MDEVMKDTKNTQTNAKNKQKKAKNCLKNASSSKKITKSKGNKKIELQMTMTPRIRLEPRLTPKSSNKNEDNQFKSASPESNPKAKIKDLRILLPRLKLEPDITPEHSNSFEENRYKTVSVNDFRTGEIDENSSLAITPCDDSYIEIQNNYESETSCVLNNNSSAIEKNLNSKSLSEDSHCSKTIEDNVVGKRFAVKKQRKVMGSHMWNDKELMDLANGLQSEGFSDFKKVAEYIKTKNEGEVSHFVKERRWNARERKNSYRGRPMNQWSTNSHENLSSWPNIRKWRKVAFNQMFAHIRPKEYSEQVIPALCKKFYEEEKEPTDPQVINVKLIYKYIMSCMSGDIPPQLPPKESALVLDLLREVRSMPIAYDFEEELKFINGFKEATKFMPFQVKDEFKKRIKTQQDYDSCPNAVSVPEEVFMELSRHKKVVQSFNPLMTPVWMLQKEQESLENHADGSSNVYIG